jgi:ABC-type multidrug transport system fused ATPase/permease subunit
VIGENVTIKIRKQLYQSIITKNIGWFDDKDNAPGVLSATMASDTQTINGVSSEGLASQLEAACSMLVSIGIGLGYCWQVALVCFGCVPFLIFGTIMNVKFQQGLSTSSDAAFKDANLLAGDAIINYRTVASFAQEEQILKDYEMLLSEPHKTIIKQAHVMGVTFGFS